MTRIPGSSRGIAALAAACATVAAVAALAVTGAGLAGVPAAAAVRVVADNPSGSPTESPCPGGEPKPCPASSEDRGEVEGQKGEVGKETEQAKQDMAAAKGEATKCPPASKQCMSDLAGDGAQQKEGMAATQKGLDDEHPAPSGNASAVVGGACDEFAAGLPAALTSGENTDASTSVCELMSR